MKSTDVAVPGGFFRFGVGSAATETERCNVLPTGSGRGVTTAAATACAGTVQVYAAVPKINHERGCRKSTSSMPASGVYHGPRSSSLGPKP